MNVLIQISHMLLGCLEMLQHNRYLFLRKAPDIGCSNQSKTEQKKGTEILEGMSTFIFHTHTHTRVRLLEFTYNQHLWKHEVCVTVCACVLRPDTSHQSYCTPWGVRGCCPTGTCRSSVLGPAIFLSTTNLMTEPWGLIAPPRLSACSMLCSVPVVLHRCLSEECLLHDWCKTHTSSSSPWPRAQPFILKWRRPAPHQSELSACSLLHCLASEKDYYFNSIYYE